MPKKYVNVTLELTEAAIAAHVGASRRLNSMKKGLYPAHKHDNERRGWQTDIEGALAEMAVAKALNVYWSQGRQGDVDVGGIYMVRGTTYKEGHLLLHEKDKEKYPYILVIGADLKWSLVGWIYGHKGKINNYLSTYTNFDMRTTCYMIPQEDLHDMRDIPKPDWSNQLEKWNEQIHLFADEETV